MALYLETTLMGAQLFGDLLLNYYLTKHITLMGVYFFEKKLLYLYMKIEQQSLI